MSRFLVEIVTNAPVELDLSQMPSIGTDISSEAYEYIKELEFKSMINRFSAEEKKEDIVSENNYCYICSESDCIDYVYSNFKDESAYVIIAENGKIEGISIYGKNGGCFIESNEDFSSDSLLKSLEKYFQMRIIKNRT